MEPSFALPLADIAARSRLSRNAFSALPDAPVRPHRSRRPFSCWPARAIAAAAGVFDR